MTPRTPFAALPLGLLCLLGGCGEPSIDPAPATDDDNVTDAPSDATPLEASLPLEASPPDSAPPDQTAPEAASPQGTSPDPDDAIPVASLGIVTLTDGLERTIVSAVFTRLPDGQRATDISAALTATSDRCDSLSDDTSLRTLSAGETLVFTASAGTWATADRIIDAGFTHYTPDSVTGLAPDVIEVHVPGGEFPTIQAAIPQLPVRPSTLAELIGIPLPADSLLVWTGASSGERLQMVFSVGQELQLCSLDDDGEAALGELLDTSAALVTIRSVARIHSTVIQVDNATLVIERRAGTITSDSTIAGE